MHADMSVAYPQSARRKNWMTKLRVSCGLSFLQQAIHTHHHHHHQRAQAFKHALFQQ
jgi:hypothetical protein